jgi:hypothetical protein
MPNIINLKSNNMDFFNIQSPNFLGGQNVHSLIKIGLATAIVLKVFKK